MYKGTLEDVVRSMYRIEKKLDPVNPKAVKKDFDDRKDKDIDNDGDVDSSDKYLHKRRKAVSKAIKGEEVEVKEMRPQGKTFFQGLNKRKQMGVKPNQKRVDAFKKSMSSKKNVQSQKVDIDVNPKIPDQMVKEDGHVDVASSIRKCKTSIEDASQIMNKLKTMDPEGSLPTWWTNKLAVACMSLNKLRDYILTSSESIQEKKDEVKMPDKMSKAMDKIVGQLTKSVKAHAKQADKLKKIADKDKVDEKHGGDHMSTGRKMTDAEMKKREDIKKGLMKSKSDFKDRYGDDADQVMNALATKMAMEAMSRAQQAAIAISKKEKGMKPKNEEPDEGNAFSAALMAAREKGEKTFVVSGKKYNVEDIVRKADVKMVKVRDPRTGQMIMKKVHPETQSSKFNESVNEDMNYKVSIEGLPDFFVSAKNPGEVKLKMRKMLKKPDMLSNVERVPDAAMKKHFRLKAQGKDEEQPMKEEVMSEEKKVVSENKLVQAVSDILSRNSFNSFRNVKPIEEKMSSKEKMAKGLYNEKMPNDGSAQAAGGVQDKGAKSIQKGNMNKGGEKEKPKQGSSMLHMCAKDVMHEKYGRGNTIFGMHAEPDENGHVSHYDIMFNHGIEKDMPISECEVLHEREHGDKMHKMKKKKKEEK